MPRHRLSQDVKTYIVTRLACYDRPTVVQKDVKKTFGVDVSLPHILYYDASSAGTQLAPKLKQLFEDTRERFKDEISELPIASKAYRLRTLQRLLERNEAKGNVVAARDDLELAEKIVGDYFTNRRELKHSGAIAGGVLAVPVPLDDEQWSAAAAQQQAALSQVAARSAPRKDT